MTNASEKGNEKTVIDFAFASDSKFVLARLCKDHASFNHEYLALLAQGLGVNINGDASKVEICRALEQHIGYHSVFTDFHVAIKSAFQSFFKSVSAPRFIQYVLNHIKHDIANPIFQYCAVVQKPQFKSLNAISHRLFGRRSAQKLKEELVRLLAKYAVILKSIDMVADGQSTSFKKFFYRKNPPYWLSGDKRLQAMAQQLRKSLAVLYKNLNASLDMIAPDIRKELSIDLTDIPVYTQIARM